MAVAEGRGLRHAYRGMPLTGAPSARFPMYLVARWFDRYADLDSSGHAPETLEIAGEVAVEHGVGDGAAEHGVGDGGAEHGEGCQTEWLEPEDIYVISATGIVEGFRKEDGNVISSEEREAEAKRWSRNFAMDTRMCHTYNHTHECKPTCFKKTEYKKPTTDGTETKQAERRQACRFRFWRVVRIGAQLVRRMGKALVPEPCVAEEADENNEYGRCKVRRQNCFRGSSNDICQVCLRCNVDLQYQVRTFPLSEYESATDVAEGRCSATEHSEFLGEEKMKMALPSFMRALGRKAKTAQSTAHRILSSFAIAMRSSHVADFYATKYLAKPQQWLANVLGPLIVGFRRIEEEKAQREDPLPVKTQALRNVRTAIFAANRAVWISCCEACLYLRTGSSAVQSHADQVVHGRKGLFMMHECKRILNGEVGGAGLWEVQLGTTAESAGGDCLQVQGGEHETSEDEILAEGEDGAADGDDAAEGEAGEDEDEEENIAEREEESATEHDDEGSATEHVEEEKHKRV